MKRWLSFFWMMLLGMVILQAQQEISQAYKDQLIAKAEAKIKTLKAFVRQAHDGSTLGNAETVFDEDLAVAEKELARIRALPVITPPPNAGTGENNDPLTQFITLMKADMLDHNVIIGYSLKKTNLELTMSDAWLLLPYPTRLRSAQDLALYWNRFESGGDIVLYDQNGTQVGGDGTAGIWVKK